MDSFSFLPKSVTLRLLLPKLAWMLGMGPKCANSNKIVYPWFDPPLVAYAILVYD